MLKRRRDNEEPSKNEYPSIKRNRLQGKNKFDDLSDELILRILSFLPVYDTTNTERVCRRLRRLASDNEMWREKFYNDFVRPRARRIPGLNDKQDPEQAKHALYYASKSARWLEHSSRVGIETDWKRRYKVKLNWTKGRCRAQEVTLDYPIRPKILIKMSQGMIITASKTGLRSYSQRSRPQILHAHYWEDTKLHPTALAIDTTERITTITVGFCGGVFEIYTIAGDGSFLHRFTYIGTQAQSAITGLAVSWPYILTMSDQQEIALHKMFENEAALSWTCVTLTNLRSDATLSPVSLSIRQASTTLTASIAYSFNRLNAGWCLGLQEIRLNLAGDIVGSRLTSTIDTPLKDFPLRLSKMSSRSASTGPLPLHPRLMHKPSTLSHSGCYILAGLPDNTMMVYTIISNKDKLDISGGRRLWGHTSSISGIEVSERGKALSVSTRGDDIRVWELEDILSSYSLTKTSTELKPLHRSQGLDAAILKRGNGLGLAVQDMKHELAWTRHWVGFDDEQVVVLGDKDQKQVLSCYDFA